MYSIPAYKTSPLTKNILKNMLNLALNLQNYAYIICIGDTKMKKTMTIMVILMSLVMVISCSCPTGDIDYEDYDDDDTTGTVATPVANQVGNTVTLTTTTPKASIYYSIDGSAPSILYTGKFVIKTNTIKAVAKRANWDDSVEFSDDFEARYNKVYRHFSDVEVLLKDTTTWHTEELTFKDLVKVLDASVKPQEPLVYNVEDKLMYTFSYVEK
jgi:hypothetical protein